MSELYEITGSQLFFNFHDGQLQAWDSTARFPFVLAGTQSGKTSWCPWWLWREIQQTADPKGGTNDYIAVTASYDLFKLKFLPSLRETFEHVLRIGRYWSGDRVIEIQDPATGKFWANVADDRMWGRIVLRSAASGGGLESLTGRGALLDECGQDEFTLETWEAVLRRLSIHRGRALGTTTPYNLGWVKTEVYDRWIAGDTDFQVISFPSYFNPQFSREEYERAKRTMPPHRFAMFYNGQFARPAGLIYDCFDDDIHIINDFDIPRHWPRYVGLDFGAVNTAKLWIAHDPDKDRYIIYRVMVSGGQSTPEHVAEALLLSKEENVVLWMGGAPSEDQQRWDWQSAGLNVLRPYISDVEGGLERVYRLFKSKRLFVFRSCRGMLDEIGTYKRKLDKKGQQTEEIENKRKFHRLDALRYIASGIMVDPVSNIPTI